MRKVVRVGLAAEANAAARLTWEKRLIREYYEKHPLTLVLSVILTAAASVTGLFFAGPLGVMVGLLLGLVCLAVGPRAMTKVRHERIERGG